MCTQNYIYQQNTKLGNSIINQVFNQKRSDTEIGLLGQVNTNEAKTLVNLQKKIDEINPIDMITDKNITFRNADKITLYDIMVFSDICTLMERRLEENNISYEEYTIGKKKLDIEFTGEDLLRLRDYNSYMVKGYDDTNIRYTIHKLSSIAIAIQCKEEFENFKKFYPNKRIVNSATSFKRFRRFLPCDDFIVTCDNNKKVNGFVISEFPSLYKYAKNLNQVVAIPSHWYGNLKTEKRTIDYQKIQEIINKRISIMKNKKNKMNSNRILFTSYDNNDLHGLYNLLDEKREYCYYNTDNPDDTDLEKKVQKRWNKRKDVIRKNVYKVLDYLISINVIKGYTDVKERKEVIGVDIQF